jgi:hypothetical protein
MNSEPVSPSGFQMQRSPDPAITICWCRIGTCSSHRVECEKCNRVFFKDCMPEHVSEMQQSRTDIREMVEIRMARVRAVPA